jgi:hypothetical protein
MSVSVSHVTVKDCHKRPRTYQRDLGPTKETWDLLNAAASPYLSVKRETVIYYSVQDTYYREKRDLL